MKKHKYKARGFAALVAGQQNNIKNDQSQSTVAKGSTESSKESSALAVFAGASTLSTEVVDYKARMQVYTSVDQLADAVGSFAKATTAMAKAALYRLVELEPGHYLNWYAEHHAGVFERSPRTLQRWLDVAPTEVQELIREKQNPGNQQRSTRCQPSEPQPTPTPSTPMPAVVEAPPVPAAERALLNRLASTSEHQQPADDRYQEGYDAARREMNAKLSTPSGLAEVLGKLKTEVLGEALASDKTLWVKFTAAREQHVQHVLEELPW